MENDVDKKKSRSIQIAHKSIGQGHPVFIVAEVAMAHDGSLGTAYAFVDAAVGAGVDAVKFQTHIAEAESSANEPFRVKFSPQDETRFDYWKRTEFSAAHWMKLSDYTREKGLIFLSSPFSVDAVDLLNRIGVPAWKVGSGEVNNPVLIESMIDTGKPILLSSGMSSWRELDDTMHTITTAGSPVLLYQCTSRYPTKAEDVGLVALQEMRDRYGVPVGLSDHSGEICFSIAATALGADSIEVHICLSPHAFGPDVPASLTVDALHEMVRGVRLVEKSLSTPQNKDQVAEEMTDMKRIFGRSVVTTMPVAAGTELTKLHLTAKKPAGGFNPEYLETLVGKRVKKDLPKDHFISNDDLR